MKNICMEKTEENIKGLAQKVFGNNWFAGRVTNGKKISHEEDKHWIEVWSKGFVPRVVVRVHPKHDIVYARRKYLEMAREFKRQYKECFLQENQHVTLRILYD
jgi:hypothetical protein